MKPHNSMAILSMCFCWREKGGRDTEGTWIRFVAFCSHTKFDLKWQKQMTSYIYKLKFQMQSTIWLVISARHYLTQSFRFRIVPLHICDALIVAVSPRRRQERNYLGPQCRTHNGETKECWFTVQRISVLVKGLHISFISLNCVCSTICQVFTRVKFVCLWVTYIRF